SRGLIALVLGGVVALIGFIGLLTTDGIGANTVFSLVTGAGILVGVVGWGLWRYTAVRRTGAFAIDGRNGRLVLLGLASVGVGVLLAAIFSSSSEARVGILISNGFARALFFIGLAVAGVLAVLVAAGKVPVAAPLVGIGICAIPAVGFLMTRQAARGVAFVALLVAGLVTLVVASNRIDLKSHKAGLAVELLTAAVVVALAFFIRSESTSAKFRTQLFSVMLLVALALVCSAIMGYLFDRRRSPDPAAE